MTLRSIPQICLLKTQIHKITQAEVIQHLIWQLQKPKISPLHIITINSEMIVEAQTNTQFRHIINQAGLVIADGQGVLQMATFQATRHNNIVLDTIHFGRVILNTFTAPHKNQQILPEKISGVDLVHTMLNHPTINQYKFFLLGGQNGITEKTQQYIKQNYPNVKIVGTEEGMISLAPQNPHNTHLIQKINQQKPDILLAALGSPKQEQWLYANLPQLATVKIAIGVGGTFDFMANKFQRAPLLWQTHGLEWLWRFLQQPTRFKRIYNATIKASWLILCEKNDKIH